MDHVTALRYIFSSEFGRTGTLVEIFNVTLFQKGALLKNYNNSAYTIFNGKYSTERNNDLSYLKDGNDISSQIGGC